MRNETIQLNGINRASAEQDSAQGACEELINMRLENGALRPVGDKELVMAPATGVPEMYRIFVHRIGPVTNYIGVYVYSTESTNIRLLNVNDGEYTLGDQLTYVDDVNAEVDIKFINNLAIVSLKWSGGEEIRVFSYRNGGYQSLPEILPDVLLSFTKEDIAAKSGSTQSTADYTSLNVKTKYNEMANPSANDYLIDVNAGLSYLRRSDDRNRTEGFVGVCCTLTLYDGTETKPTQPVWFYLGGTPEIIFGNISNNTGQDDLHINIPRGRLKVGIGSITTSDGMEWDADALYDEYKDYISAINIYCTYPKSLVDIEKTFKDTLKKNTIESYMSDWRADPSEETKSHVMINATDIEYRRKMTNNYSARQYSSVFSFDFIDPSELGKELFYKQRSIKLHEHLDDMDDKEWLDFSDEMLTGDTMRVENSAYIKRYGQMEVYNKRLHLYDTTNTLLLPADDDFGNGLFSQALVCNEGTVAGMQSYDVNVRAVIYTKTETEDLIAVREFSTKGFGINYDPSGTGTHYYAWLYERLLVYTQTLTLVDNNTMLYEIYNGEVNELGVITGHGSDQDLQADYLTYNGNRYYREETMDKTIYPPAMAELTYLALRSFSPVTDSRTYRMDLYVKYSPGGLLQDAYYKIPVNLETSKAYNYAYLAAKNERFFKFIHDVVPTDYTSIAFQYGLIDLSEFTSTSEEWEAAGNIDEVTQYRETDIVVVSKENNPTFFPPQQSYRIGGNIIGIAVNSQGVSDVQIGQYPMNVFTDNGVYAMELGSGEVVYGNVVKIADDIAATGGMIPTPYGIAFLQGDGVYLLNGRRSQRISIGLDGFVDLDIRRCQQYRNAHGYELEGPWYCWKYTTGTSLSEDYLFFPDEEPIDGDYMEDSDHNETHYYVKSNKGQYLIIGDDEDEESVSYFDRYEAGDLPAEREVLIYDIFPYLLGEREATSEGELIPLSFRDQMREPENILIGYDNNREELWISDIRELFSYVYSFPERSWHTVTATFDWYNVNYGVIGGVMYDITKENHSDDTIRHIQSRPIKLGSDSYKVIERMIARVNINGPLESTPVNQNMFSMYVFGSRDLRNWYMIGANQWNGYSQSLQINKTSSKFRAFIVTAGGNLTRGSEFSYISATIGDYYTAKLR